MTERKRGMRVLRGVLWVVVCTVLLAIVLVVGAELALKSPGVRGLVVSRLASWSEANYGLDVEVGDLSLSVLRGLLDIEDLRLGVGESEPFLRVKKIHVVWRPRSILSGRVWIDDLLIERPEVDLGRSLPEMPESEEPSKPGELPLRIDRLRLLDAAATGPVPEGVSDVVADWRIDQGRIEASIIGSSFTAEKIKASLTSNLEPSEIVALSSLELDLEAEAAGRFDGDVRIVRAAIQGDALALEGSALLGLGSGAFETEFRASTDPGIWLTGRAGAPLEVEGEVDLAQWAGGVTISAPELPGRLLRSLVDDAMFADFELEDTTAALEGRIDLVESRAFVGDVRASVSKGGETIVRAVVGPRLELPTPDSEAIALSTDLELLLLPQEQGLRKFTATIAAGDIARTGEWRIDRGDLELEVPDLDRVVSNVARMWPRLVQSTTVADLPPLGRLEGSGSVSGAMLDPAVDVGLEWRPHRNGRVESRLVGRPRSDLELVSDGSDLELEHFLAGVQGRLEWSATVRGLPGDPRGGIHAAVWNLESDGEELFEVFDIRLDGDRSMVEWAFDGSSSSFGQLEGRGTVVPSARLRRADGTVRVTPGEAPLLRGVDFLDGSFTVRDGAVGVDLAGYSASEKALSLGARVPLGALASIPGAEVLAKLPLERSPGLIEVDWVVAERDWSEMIPTSWHDQVSRLEGGSSGRIELDVECPGCARASAGLTGILVEVDGRRLAAEDGLDLALADGLFRLGPLEVVGEELTLTLDGFAELDKEWRFGQPLPGLVTRAEGAVDGDVGSGLFTAVAAENSVEIVEPGVAEVRGRWSLQNETSSGELTIGTTGLVIGLAALPETTLAEPRISLTLAGDVLTIENAVARVAEGDLELVASVPLVDPLDGSIGSLRLRRAVPVLESLDVPFVLRGGRLVITDGRIETADGGGTFRLDLPLDRRDGASLVTADWEVPPTNWAPLLKVFTGLEEPSALLVGSSGDLQLDLLAPALAEGVVTISEAVITTRERATSIADPVTLTVGGGEVRLPSARLVSGSQAFDVSGRAVLDQEWGSGESLAELVSAFELEGSGTLDSALVNPFLYGGRAEGPVEVRVELGGSPLEPVGQVTVAGPEVSVLYRTPYLVRLSQPRLKLVLDRGGILIDEGTAQLNSAPLELSGIVGSDGETQVDITFDDALFRLDYGLLATVDGDVRYESSGDGTALVSGDIVVERGTLTRDVQVDFDLLTELLAPIDLSTTAEDPLSLVELDLRVATREGVRVRNNIGDLLARWEPIAVTGSAARPVLEGSLEIDPGGLLYAYGQTVRLDRAEIEYPGGEFDEPRLTFEATTSIEDPTIASLAGDDPFRRQTDTSSRDDDERNLRDRLTDDLTQFYGEQVASRVGETVGAKISLRPLLIFGEADPGARLTVSRDFSTNLAVAASIDLTNAENRTYLVEAHDFRAFPGFVGQAFTDDDSDYGGAVLQRRQFGGSRRESEADLPRVRRIRTEKVPGLSKRGLKRALGLSKGDPFAPRDQFAAEVEVLDYLMRKGYPNAMADVKVTPIGKAGRKVRIDLAVQPGPHVEFEFEGERIPKSLRRLIRSNYRTDFFEPESIEAMREEAKKALRSQGFVEPEVSIDVSPVDAASPDGDRIVTIFTSGGLQIDPQAPVFESVDPGILAAEDLEALGQAFFSPVQRVELAEGLEQADARLLRALEDLGFPEARIANRFTSLEDRRLTVTIDTGPRRRISRLAISSEDEIDTASLEALVKIDVGDPLRRAALSRSAMSVERSLADAGFLDARVRTVVGPAPAGDPFEVPVRFEVERGNKYVVDDVEFSGLRSTREKWVAKVAGVEEGETLERGDLAEARTALWRTGLFSAVNTETEDLGSGRRRVVFDLAERDRYRLAYGVRWDSEDGESAVFDVTDDNFLGRSWTLGFRGLYSDDDKSIRWLTRVPRAGGGRGSIELFALARELVEAGILSEELETTLQYSRPVGRRVTLRMYGRYRDTRLSEVDPDPFFPLDERIKSPLLGWQYIFDSRGPEFFFPSGTFLSVDLSGSEEFLGSDFRFARVFAQLNLFRPAGRLLDRQLLWAQSFRVGFARAFDQELLRDERFFAGGEYSVRGYGTESLGPQETLGDVVRALGGEALLVVNQELHWRLLQDYVLLGFVDVGNVWEDTGDFGSDLFTSVGLGVRAATPVGLIRFDIALPLDAREGIDSDYELYLGLGSTF